jgi:hypothetical protein
VVASNLTANNNGPTSSAVGEQSHNGVTIANDFNPAKSMNVTLLGINTFSGNYNTGLSVTSNGNIILTSLNANGNGDSGAGNLDPFGDGVFVDNSNATAIKTVTLNGANMFNGNLELGLDIRSRGAIIVNKITANSNGEWGTYLYNQDGTSAAPVTIIGYGNFNNNLNNGTLTTGDEAGLAVFSNGAITLNNVIALSNANVGVYLDNERYTRGGPTDTAAPVNVTLNGNNTFNDNGLQGLMVFSDGLITLTNITANNNQSGAGVYADNQTRAKAGTANVRSIILKGWGTFTNNTGGEGLMILASGSISLTRVTANNNAGAGVIVDSANSSILFTCGSLNLNGDAGYILSGTVVTLKGVYSFGNGAANSVTGTQVFTRSCPLP